MCTKAKKSLSVYFDRILYLFSIGLQSRHGYSYTVLLVHCGYSYMNLTGSGLKLLGTDSTVIVTTQIVTSWRQTQYNYNCVVVLCTPLS